MTNGTCSVDGCEKKCQARKLCSMHYKRLRVYGDLGSAAPLPTYVGCVIPGCDRVHNSGGLCGMHYRRKRRTGSVDTVRPSTRSGAEHPAWTGEDATYPAVHFRLRIQQGKASEQACVDCGLKAHHWSYDHQDPNEIPATDEWPVYSVNLTHYQPRCRACHRRFDISNALQRRAS